MKCIDCEFAVMSVKDPKMCKCWKVEPAKRELKNAMIKHECSNFKFGIMDNLRARVGWKV
jgi:hypothetical protein